MSKTKMISPIVEVVEVSELKQDKNGRDYKTIRLQGLSQEEVNIAGKKYMVKSRTKAVSMNQYKQSYLDDRPDAFFDAQVGDFLNVEIHTAEVKPYDIPLDDGTGEVRTVTSYTFPVIKGDNPVTVLKNNDRELADEDSAPVVQHAQEEEVEEEVSIT